VQTCIRTFECLYKNKEINQSEHRTGKTNLLKKFSYRSIPLSLIYCYQGKTAIFHSTFLASLQSNVELRAFILSEEII
jgi:hypothetical protein